MKIKRLFLGLLLLCGLSFSLVPQPVKAETTATPATTLVKNFYAQLLETMKQGEKLGFEGRYKKLGPTIKSTFNLPLMAHFAVGPGWNTAAPAAQQKLVDAFSNFSIATYASRFKKFDGEQFDVVGEKPAAQGGVIVETKLTPKGSDPVTLNYLVRPDEHGALRIVDVYLDAAISELATRRSEFTAIVKREGFDALVQSLESKTKKMGA